MNLAQIGGELTAKGTKATRFQSFFDAVLLAGVH